MLYLSHVNSSGDSFYFVVYYYYYYYYYYFDSYNSGFLLFNKTLGKLKVLLCLLLLLAGCILISLFFLEVFISFKTLLF